MEIPRPIAGERQGAGPDARGSVRAPLAVAVDVRFGGTRQRARAADLSETGLGIIVRGDRARALVTGHEVEVEFALPGLSPPLALAAQIVWHDSSAERLGVRFQSLDPGLAALLDAFARGRL